MEGAVMVPLLIAEGAGAASRLDIGLVIAAGMTIGTLFTLFVTPAVYTYIARDHQKAKQQTHETLAEADEMLAACRKAGTHIAVAHQTRAIPYMERIRDMVRTGAIGKLMRIRGKGKDDQRGGALDLIVLGTHIMDQMRYYAGDPLWAVWAERSVTRGRGAGRSIYLDV